MSLKSKITPLVTGLITSDKALSLQRLIQEFNRKRQGLPHQVIFYHKVDDPYSYLLLQMLQQLMGDFDIKVKPRIVGELSADMIAELELLEAWSIKDCQRLAQAFNLDFPDCLTLPRKSLCERAERILLSNEKSDSFLQFAIDVNKALWVEGEEAIAALETEIGHVSHEQRDHVLKQNKRSLQKNGHYLSATLHYGGEWYWGVDRIYHLAERFMKLDIAKTAVDLNDYQYPTVNKAKATNSTGDSNLTANKALDFYFSFRSPYSYIAVSRAIELCEKYQVELNIKPVLPMVTRGIPVPNAKKIYIFLDTKREARRHQLEFGKAVDPLGNGVSRCMAIFTYAKEQGKQKEYLHTVSKGIWAQGKDVASDQDLAELVTKSGLSWNTAKTYIDKKDWQDWAEANRLDMYQLGFWGVPSFQYGSYQAWGQDRLWAVESEMLSQQ